MASGNGTSAWEVRFSNSRQVAYFFNRETGASEWEPPKGLSDVQIRRLPGADKYLTPVDRNKHSEGGQAGGRASVSIPLEEDGRGAKANIDSRLPIPMNRSERDIFWLNIPNLGDLVVGDR